MKKSTMVGMGMAFAFAVATPSAASACSIDLRGSGLSAEEVAEICFEWDKSISSSTPKPGTKFKAKKIRRVWWPSRIEPR